MVTIGNGHSQAMGLLTLNAAVHAGVGAATAGMISLNPMIGVTFGATYLLGSHAVNLLEQWMESKGYSPFNNDTAVAKVMKFAIAFLGGIALASSFATMIGAPIVFSVGMTFTLAMFATTMAIATFVTNHSQAKEVIIGPGLLSALRC